MAAGPTSSRKPPARAPPPPSSSTRPKPAAYGWDVVEGSWTGEQADLVRDNNGADRALLEGWIQLNHATELFTAAGLDIDKMRAAANKPGFKPVPMTGLKASATINQTVEKRTSRNVVGTVKGASKPDEHLLLMAHWDHLGKGANADPGADVIHNGAIDNATGIAAILEIAEKDRGRAQSLRAPSPSSLSRSRSRACSARPTSASIR